jgi:ectoine hydroxylase-related dioxygenase (phytanoyl-CoA dioxygenase family)
MTQENVARFFAAVLEGKVPIEPEQQSCTSSPDRFVQLSEKFGYPFSVAELQAEIASHIQKPHVLQLFETALKDENLKQTLKQASHPEELRSALQPLGYQFTADELNAIIYTCCHCVRGLWCECRAGSVGKAVYERSRAATGELPDLSAEYAIASEQVHSFHRDGHLRLRSVLSPSEVTAYKSALSEAVHRYDRERQAMEKSVGGQSRGWKFVENLWRLSPAARQFTLAQRFSKIAADLLGVDTVRLFRDQSYFKEPGGDNTPWHQDGYFMPLDTMQIVTMWVALSDVSLDMSPMSFATGSHRRGYLGASMPPDEAMDAFEQSLQHKGFPIMSYGAMVAGDATFHTGWTLHSSRMNTSQRVREAMVIVYYADGARVTLPPTPANAQPPEQFAAIVRQNNLASCLPGLKSGDLAETFMNPIVYQR